MLEKLFIILMFLRLTKQSHQGSKQFLLKLTPEQVMETFDGVMSDDYIKLLAKDFAAKAAAHFMHEIKNRKHALVKKLNTERANENKRIPKATKKNVEMLVNAANEAVHEAVNEEKASKNFDENEAFRLINAPDPDGDHLESSGEVSQEEKKKIPVIQVTKINGIYYRRLLGMI